MCIRGFFYQYKWFLAVHIMLKHQKSFTSTKTTMVRNCLKLIPFVHTLFACRIQKYIILEFIQWLKQFINYSWPMTISRWCAVSPIGRVIGKRLINWVQAGEQKPQDLHHKWLNFRRQLLHLMTMTTNYRATQEGNFFSIAN